MSVPFHPFRPFDCWGRRRAANRFVPAMLADYAVPPMPALPQQLLPNPGLDDPAAWTAAAGWSLDGEGATKTAGNFARLTPLGLSLPPSATDLVLTFDVINQTSLTTTGGTGGCRALVSVNGSSPNTSNANKYLGWLDNYQTVPQVSHVRNRTAAQVMLQIDGGNLWGGTIANPMLYDVSYARDLPTITWIPVGQSNEEGFGNGRVIKLLDQWHPNIWMCPSENYVQYGAIKHALTVAQEPLVHNGSPGHKVGKGMPAARRLVSLTNGAIRVVIIPVAKSGVGMLSANAQGGWNPDTTMTGAANRYATMIAAYNAAVAQIPNHIGTIMSWSGNEADLQVANWQTQLPAMWRKFADRARADMGQPNMPIIISGPVIPDPTNKPPLALMQRSFAEDSGSPNAIPGVYYFDGPEGQAHINGVSDVTGATDLVHFTSAANRRRGDMAGQIAYGIGQARGWWT